MRSRLVLVAALIAFAVAAPRTAAAQRYPTRDRLDAIERQRERAAESRERMVQRREAARERAARLRERAADRAADRAAERRLSRPSRVYRNRW